MYKDAIRPAWAEINLSNLDYNIKSIRAKVGADKELIGVIKADAYGHGSVMCADVLRKNGVKTFAVATLQEAVTLREAGAAEEIIMLGLTPDMYADTIAEYDITPVVCSAANAKAISDAAAALGKTVSGLVAVDTGMGRIGYLADDIENAVFDIKKMTTLPNFKIKGLFSHMSTADAYDKTYSHQQEGKYNRSTSSDTGWNRSSDENTRQQRFHYGASDNPFRCSSSGYYPLRLLSFQRSR